MKIIIALLILFVNIDVFSQLNIGERYKTTLGGTKIYGKNEKISRNYLYKLVDSNLRYINNNFRNCWNCQYSILDGDTIDYYDSKGLRQGDFVTFCSYFDKYGLASCGLNEYCICKDCNFIEERMNFKNDTLVSQLKLGYKRKHKIDTLSFYMYERENQRIYKRFTNEENGFYWVGYTNMEGDRQGLVKKYDVKTKKLIEEGNYKDNEYSGNVIYYFENGTVMARALYENEKKKVFHTFYRENGIKYAEVDVKDSKIVSKICFDEKGEKKIPCDSNKTLTGRPKAFLNILPNGEVQISR